MTNVAISRVAPVMAAVAITIAAYPAGAVDETLMIVNQPPDLIAWEKSPEGASFATLWGDLTADKHGAMVKLPGGVSSPMHIHSEDIHGVVISGTFSHIAKGADPSTEIDLPPGSYYLLPANLPHISKCISEVECVTFIYQDAKFDFVPTRN